MLPQARKDELLYSSALLLFLSLLLVMLLICRTVSLHMHSSVSFSSQSVSFSLSVSSTHWGCRISDSLYYTLQLDRFSTCILYRVTESNIVTFTEEDIIKSVLVSIGIHHTVLSLEYKPWNRSLPLSLIAGCQWSTINHFVVAKVLSTYCLTLFMYNSASSPESPRVTKKLSI